MPYENYGLRNKVLLAIPEFYLHSRPGSGNLNLLPLLTTTTFRQRDGRTLHVRKATGAEPELMAIYRAS